MPDLFLKEHSLQHTVHWRKPFSRHPHHHCLRGRARDGGSRGEGAGHFRIPVSYTHLKKAFLSLRILLFQKKIRHSEPEQIPAINEMNAPLSIILESFQDRSEERRVGKEC